MPFTRYELLEGKRGFYILGLRQGRYSVLIMQQLSLLSFACKEAPSTYSAEELPGFFADLGDEVKPRGPPAWGLLGLISFTYCYYLCMVTRCSVVALVGGNKIYHIDETKLIPLVHSSRYEPPDRRSIEARLASTFHSLDLANTFYFSPTYDLSSTLQMNLSGGERHASMMFVWNAHLLAPLAQTQVNAPHTESAEGAALPEPTRKRWFLEIIHGFIDQARISVLGNPVYITLIARRSKEFAGARFFKRGVNNEGYPANEVETEQIVSNQLHSFFGKRYTSYVQHRGSICVQWSQISSNMSPQPPIRIDAVNPYYELAAKHFDRMLQRYGFPIRVLNLVKTREKRPREGVLSREFENCIRYLNQFLPVKRSLITNEIETRRHLRPTAAPSKSGRPLHLTGGVLEYTHWDMSRAAKSESSEVIDYLERYAHQTLQATSLFQPGVSAQSGVCRTNCIDCLDRTNAAQSVIAKHALGYQLYALGILDRPHVDYDTDVMDLLTEMYHDHGDTLALQYGGSNLVNTVETYRRINQWSSHSRDLIERIRRYYSNSFMDAQRQDAINVFLGNYQYQEGFNLWDLSTDYYLHNVASTTGDRRRRSYRLWYEPRLLLQPNAVSNDNKTKERSARASPFATPNTQTKLTSLSQLFLYKINSTDKYSTKLVPFRKSAPRNTQRHPPRTPAPPIPEEPATPISAEINESLLFYTRYMHSAPTTPEEDVLPPLLNALEIRDHSYSWPTTPWDVSSATSTEYEQYLNPSYK